MESCGMIKNLKLNGRLIMPKKYHTGNQKLLLINKKKENYSKKLSDNIKGLKIGIGTKVEA